MKTANLLQVRLINYFDVYGNNKDGYQVNDLCTEFEGKVDSKNFNSKSDILKWLKQIGFFKKTCRIASFRLVPDYIEHAEIESRKGRPICRIEFPHK